MPKPGTRRRPLRELSACSLALLVALMLGACTQPPPKPIPSASSTAEPVFASDAEALAAAEEAYGLYYETWNTIARDGGVNPQRIVPFTSASFSDSAVSGLERFEEEAVRASGDTVPYGMKVQSVAYDSTVPRVVVYVCLDYSDARLINSSGTDVTPTDRLELNPISAEFIGSKGDPATLVLDRNDKWPGQTFCE